MAKAKKPGKMVTFVSKYRNYMLIVEATWYEVVGIHRVVHKGIECQFTDGKFTTDDVDLIKRLREDERFGEEYFERPEDLPKENPETPPAPQGDVPPVVKPRTRGPRSTVDAPVKT